MMRCFHAVAISNTVIESAICFYIKPVAKDKGPLVLPTSPGIKTVHLESAIGAHVNRPGGTNDG
jgi:hypothetical protein